MPSRERGLSGFALVDGLEQTPRPTISDYCKAAAEYIRGASACTAGQAKCAQTRLSDSLGVAFLADLRDRLQQPLPTARTGEHEVGGGLRTVQADVSEMTQTNGLTLAVELKPVHLAVGRAIWNRFGDIRVFAVNIHLKFPFAVVGGVMTLPTKERLASGDDAHWKTTTQLVTRAVARFSRASSRLTEGDAPHLLEGIGIVVFDHETGVMDPELPPEGSGVRWPEFVAAMAVAYEARFAEL